MDFLQISHAIAIWGKTQKTSFVTFSCLLQTSMFLFQKICTYTRAPQHTSPRTIPGTHKCAHKGSMPPPPRQSSRYTHRVKTGPRHTHRVATGSHRCCASVGTLMCEMMFEKRRGTGPSASGFVSMEEWVGVLGRVGRCPWTGGVLRAGSPWML